MTPDELAEFIQQAGNVRFQCAAVFQRFVTESIKHLRVDHGCDEIPILNT